MNPRPRSSRVAAVLVIALKDLLLLWRDKAAMFWVLAFPLMFALFFGAFYSGILDRVGSPMGVAILDDDGTEMSRDFVERLAASPAIERVDLTRQDAIDRVRKDRLVAAIVVKRGFGAPGRLIASEESLLQVLRSPSRKAEGAFLEGILAQTTLQLLGARMAKAGAFGGGARGSDDVDEVDAVDDATDSAETSSSTASTQSTPSAPPARSGAERILGWSGPKIEVKPAARRPEVRPRTSYEITFPSAILWGIQGCVAAFAISIAQERAAGTFLRLRFAPVTRRRILAGKGLACFLACAVVILLLMGFGMAIFGVRVENPLGLLAATLATSLCFVGIMMFTAVLGRTEQAVAGAGWGFFMPLAMFGGAMVPLMFMPDWLRAASDYSPVKWAILALEGAIWRDFTWSEMAMPCLILPAFGAGFYALGSAIFARMED